MVSTTAPHRLVSMRTKLGVLLGTVAALAVAIPTIFHALTFLSNERNNVAEDNLELARAVGRLTEWRIEQTFILLDFIATAPGLVDDLQASDAQRLTDRLERSIRRDDDLTSAMIVDREGTVIAHTLADKRLVGQSMAGTPQFQGVLQTGQPTMGRALKSSVSGKAVVPFAAPIRAPNGDTLGAALVFLSLDRLEAQVNGARGPGRGLARIVDGEGRLLTSTDPDMQLADVSTDNPVVGEALGGAMSVGPAESLVDGPVIAAALPISGGWVVEVHHPIEVVLAPVRQMLVRSGLIALAAFAAAMLVGGFAARRFTEPMLALLRALHSIHHEEGRPTLPRSSTTEVAWLADELDAMRSALEARTVEMRRALDTLARYRLLSERTTDIVLFLHPGGTIVDLNAAAEHSHDYARADLIGRPIHELLADPTFRLSTAQIAQAQADGLRFETTHRRADGTTFPVEVTLIGTDRADTAASPVMMAIIRDVSTRLAAEEALRTSEARYRNVVDTIRDIVFQVDANDCWTFLNSAWTDVTEYTIAETLGRRASEAIHPDDREGARELFRSFIRQRTAVARFEARYLTRSGTTRWLEIYANLTFGADGSYLGSSGTLSDVTERRQAEAARARLLVREQALLASQERAAEIAGIVQHMPCGVLVFDTQSCLTLANERAVEMLSTDRSETGDGEGGPFVPHPSDLLGGRQLNPCRVLVAHALGGGMVSDREILVTGADGEARILIGSAAPLLSAHGQVRGAVAILTDVTRERRLVQDLVQSEGTLRHSLESLWVLHEAGQALSSTLVEEEIGDRLAESCVRIGRLDAALVFLYDDHGEARLLGTSGDPVLIEHVLGCPEEREVRRRALTEPPAPGALPERPCQEMLLAVRRHIELTARGRTIGVLETYGTGQVAGASEDAVASLAAHAVSALGNAHLYREVGDREQRLQDALRHLLVAQEEERRRVAYELHDGLAQVAAATHLSLQTFASQYRPRAEQTRHQLEKSVDLARRVVREARQVIAGLRPTVLDDFGLERALRLHVQELTGEGWSIEYEPRVGPERLPGPIETVLYRIAQEALTNVRKHAGTLAATIRLIRQDDRVLLEIIDAGVGFNRAASDVEVAPGHCIGLVGMQERAALVGGAFTIESEPGHGTRVRVEIPLPAATRTQERAAMAAVGA